MNLDLPKSEPKSHGMCHALMKPSQCWHLRCRYQLCLAPKATTPLVLISHLASLLGLHQFHWVHPSSPLKLRTFSCLERRHPSKASFEKKNLQALNIPAKCRIPSPPELSCRPSALVLPSPSCFLNPLCPSRQPYNDSELQKPHSAFPSCVRQD